MLLFGVIFVILRSNYSTMNLRKLFIGLLVAAGFTMFFGSCGMDVKTIEPYLIKIDSIYAPDTVAVKSVFIVNVFGYVGPSKCYAFEKLYHYTNNQNEIIIEAWAKYAYYGDPCVEEVVRMSEELELGISTPGTYLLKALQPGNYYLEKKLVVK
jgi:hypothetical protein